MNESEKFRENLLRIMEERGLKAAELSRMAGLNLRAVKDIEERRVQSPKISTVFALATALGVDPAELLGLGQRINLAPQLAELLSRYSESEQELLLRALSVLPGKPS